MKILKFGLCVCVILAPLGGCDSDDEPERPSQYLEEDSGSEGNVKGDGKGEQTDGNGKADGDSNSGGDGDSDADSESVADGDSSSDVDDYDGQCPTGQVCYDVTGAGDYGCLLNGDVPPENQGGCDANTPCPAHHTCYSYADGSGTICIQDCFECQPGDDSSCPEGEFCDSGMCMPVPCTEDSCSEGEVCWEGTCIPDIGDGPPANPGIACDLPPLECDPIANDCGELIQFDPVFGDGYIDYPENGETENNQYRSWLRRDTVMLIKYAAAKVACLAKDWEFGNGGPVGLIDMSEQKGDIPGTSIGEPGHPAGTHVGGRDIDVAYYQVNTADNRARPICGHYQGGQEAYHCTATPHLLDPWRQALFIGALFEHPYLRVIGCDGKAGPMLDMARGKICEKGWLPGEGCAASKLAYEVTDNGYGWYYFHHHHIHVSFNGTPGAQSLSVSTMKHVDDFRVSTEMCMVPECEQGTVREYNARYVPLRRLRHRF